MRTPKHIGIIPDGNRRWAEEKKMTKEKGYENGLDPGLILFRLCKEVGIKEITYYGFTTDKFIYSDFYVLDDYWPDFNPEHFYNALKWYNEQDVTLGG